MQTPHNIYIHVPFCIAKCNYCAFFSRACAAPDWDEYARGIISEIHHWAQIMGRVDVPTIFFGGGTPSLMPVETFANIMDNIATHFNITENCEITLESNPGTLDAKKLADFGAAGANRLSVGVQSLDDARLRFLGRRHTARDAVNLMQAAMKMNMRLSADFIYGLPGDGVETVAQMCRGITELGLQHCSMYELTIEPGTPFAKMNLQMPTNEEMAQMYDAIARKLPLPRYEVSNYAAPGQECRHNQNVWDGAPYIGIGAGAAGRPFIDGTWYEQMGANARCAPLPHDARGVEKVITGLRQTRGVMLDVDTKNVINMDYADAHPDLLTRTPDGRIAATPRGMLILDEVILKLVK